MKKDIQKAVVKKCSDNTSIQEHTMLDFCSKCAPFWDEVPFCPVHKIKLHNTPKCQKSEFADLAYCGPCRKYYKY